MKNKKGGGFAYPKKTGPSNRWVFEVGYHGGTKRFTVKWAKPEDEKDFEKARAKVLAIGQKMFETWRVAEERAEAEALRLANAQETVGQFLVKYMAEAKFKDTTRLLYQNTLDVHVKPTYLWDKPWKLISQEDAILFQNQVKVVESKRGMRTIRSDENIQHRVLKVLFGAFKSHCEERQVPNPFLIPEKKRAKSTTVKKPMVPPEKWALILEATRVKDLDLWRVLVSMYYTATRSSEAFGLRRSSVDLLRNRIAIRDTVALKTFRKDTTKTKSSTRRIPIAPELRSILEEVFAGSTSPFVLTCDGEMWLYSTFKARWDAIVDSLGLQYAPHQIRHLTATLMIRAHRDIAKAVSRLLGHANLSTTMNIYEDAFESDFDDIAASLELHPKQNGEKSSLDHSPAV